MAKQYLVVKPFIVWVPRDGAPSRKIEYLPGMLVDDDEVPEGQSGQVWCSEAHGLAREVNAD